MKKNRMRQKLLPLFLTAVMILNMYNLTVLAGTEPPEMAETAELPEAVEELEEPEVPEKMEVSKKPEIPEVPELSTMSENSLTVSGNALTVNENSLTDIAPVNELVAAPGLLDAVLKDHIVRGQNPEGAVVNLFDYWQYSDDHNKEEVWDWKEDDGTEVEICNMGISRGHLLRFGQTEEGKEGLWNYGAWNRYSKGRPYQGIVQNTLGADGFPRLNFKERETGDFGKYAANYPSWLDNAYREESLVYLFSVKQDAYKASYGNVQGLFQRDQEGYYYYNSQKNFAEFDEANSRFILYDSPGVGTTADSASGSKGNFGEFFPFNKASEVFNTAYEKTDGKHPYSLSYTEEEEPGDGTGKTEDPPSYIVRNGNASFLSCTYPALNHYIGMTLEVPFLQTVGGRLDDGSPMTFTFSGDDDVWIFIDGVLVADLGGIHDAYELSINFADGKVSIPSLGEAGVHTLLDSFVAAGRSVDAFSGNTFADNTKHKLQMFYLERGHMASNLSLSFNVVALENPESSDSGDDAEEPLSETGDPEEASGANSDVKADPAGPEQGQNAVGPPRTGDDSMIGWWAALNLISLLGICATVYNLILRNGREKKRVSKGK